MNHPRRKERLDAVSKITRMDLDLTGQIGVALIKWARKNGLGKHKAFKPGSKQLAKLTMKLHDMTWDHFYDRKRR